MSDRNSKLLARFQKCLEEEEKNDVKDHEQEARISKTVFWSEMRDIIAVNALSSALDILDDVAKVLIDDTGRAAQALSGPVTILTHSSKQSASTGATPHPLFTSPARKRSVPTKPAKGSTSKKQTASVSPKTNPVASGTPLITFPLAMGLPEEFVRDLEGIFRHVAAVNLNVWQRAYPWANQHLFYDPVEDPDVYLGHWRFWHNCRAAFFEWALHAPLRTDSDKVQRRKRKGNAVHQRLVFISLCIETWGYYNFLRRIEAPGNGTLMWWGGQTGNTTEEAKGYSCTPIQNLYKLFQKDKAAYQRKIHDAIKPFQIDMGGFTTITEMLEQTEALNSALVEYEKRLSDKALARVAMDLTSWHFVPDHWVPSDDYELPTVPPFNSKEFKPDFSLLMDDDGKPTALSWATAVDDSDTKYRPDPDEEAGAELADEEAKAEAAQQEGEEEEESEGEDDVTIL
ncbi:hypothetical protein PF005_g20143 [Phytophthora fragariae]|uniref:Uncharacterized protein n=1 Tax=Phytophthora fragariae TaxID=53985 RepID=A0A6A3XI49_9STRA|nr:hypothetical protein PF005_g20143 [Phytophthora fragariae]KAE9202506.1 hypothetical protein PF002_g21222 [Phytophthora fragariae]